MSRTKMHQLTPAGEEAEKPRRAWLNKPALGRLPHTDLGRLLLAARQEFVVSEGRFLDREELAGELAGRRGDVSREAEG